MTIDRQLSVRGRRGLNGEHYETTRCGVGSCPVHIPAMAAGCEDGGDSVGQTLWAQGMEDPDHRSSKGPRPRPDAELMEKEEVKMATRKVYHVTPKGDGQWQGKLERASRASVVGNDKADVVEATKDLARGSKLGQIVIHRGDGVIQTEHTYGEDPERYKG